MLYAAECAHCTISVCSVARYVLYRVTSQQLSAMQERSAANERQSQHEDVKRQSLKATTVVILNLVAFAWGSHSNWDDKHSIGSRDVRWSKFVGTGKERNAFPFKKDLSRSCFFSFFLFPRSGLSSLSYLSWD